MYGILRAERERGFDDGVVVGGLDEFIRQRAGDLAPHLSGIESYASLTPEQRGEWAGRVVRSMRAALKDAGVSAAQPPTPKPAPRKRPPPQKSQRRPPQPQPPLKLGDDISLLKGVWRNTLPRLQKLGVEKVGDLVYMFPSRHSDFTAVRKVAQLTPGDVQTAILTVWESSQTMLGRRKSSQAALGDDTGIVRAVWFGNPWIAPQLKRGGAVALSGKVSVFRGNLVFQSPEFELLESDADADRAGRLSPVYPTTQGLPQRSLRALVRRALDAALDEVEEFLPEDVRHRVGLIGLRDAVRLMHYPDDLSDFRDARRRLAFDEMFMHQLSLLMRRRRWKDAGEAQPLSADAAALDAFLSSLPFDLTAAQTRAMREILADMSGSRAMSRLLQGDVGSGKTVVAVVAALVAARNGRQAAIMAPTEILAEQHFLTVCGLLDGPGFVPAGGGIQRLHAAGLDRPLVVALLLGAQRKRERGDIAAMLSAGMIDIIVGTHALIQKSVEIPNLALAVVDEQHRFGVLQRAMLREKGVHPHFLAMSATPIPRSLSMTIYGDLDVSLVDELPPGRKPVRTRFVPSDRRDSAYQFMRGEIEAGRQAFVVCPLIDESESIQTSAAQREYERLSSVVFPDLAVGLVHGRMSLVEKEAVMGQFERRELDVLVATPVIEVGIDVPNATVMLIDGAERFGLSQLHQFRGRVGRGAHQSHCLLMSESPGAEAVKRLKLLERISDGFELAEEDLKMRGAGDYLGTRQSGVPSFRVAQITDQDIIALARREADLLLSRDAELARPEHARLAARFAELQADATAEAS